MNEELNELRVDWSNFTLKFLSLEELLLEQYYFMTSL